ncbi:alkaline phosphatase family protein [Achromobacter sp. NPDC058515]|uniref:alkaline phosphatase family protein n=1 Tax=Achromobacter sp. NPDC058515 TaxID=3346533 RepID=UPI0036687874
MLMQSLSLRRWCATLLATSALVGCGGSEDDDDGAVVPPTQPPTTESGQPSVDKVVFIGIDGLTYDGMMRGLSDKSLPNIGQLTATRAWTGGMTGSTTQQPTLPAPSWATLLTGQWADQHGIRFNSGDQALASPTLFQRVKAALPDARTAAAFNSTLLANLLNADRDAGYLQTLTDCAGQDDCVASQARDRIAEGYDVVVAQFGAPARIASEVGYGSSYDASIRQADATIGALTTQIADRKAEHPNENWMVIVASSHGLGKAGAIDGSPLSSTKTIFLASSRPNLLGGRADDAALDGVWDSKWYALPSGADLAPTLLDHLGASPVAAAYDMAGASLFEPLALRRTAARTATDNRSVTLSWLRVGEPAGEIVVGRNGVEIARLPGTATEYIDKDLAFDTGGVHTVTYSVSMGSVVSAASTTVNYFKPPPLLASLRTGLTMLFPFEGNLTDVAAGGGSITPFDGVQTPTFEDPGVFGKTFKNMRSASPVGGFKLNYPAGMLNATSAFTIGFWFQSDGISTDRAVFGNKDYNAWINPGIMIGQWTGGGAMLYFNLADGKHEVDISEIKFTPNKPVYVAWTIDSAAKTSTAYVYDSERGFSSTTKGTGSVDLGLVAGVLGPHFGLNEDGAGTYGVCCSYGKGPYTMYFDDLAYWSRALTEEEIKSLALSGKSVSELFP